MTRTTWNDLDQAATLSTKEQKAVHGGFWFYRPYFAPYSRYAGGYGGFNNVFQRGTFGYGVQAGTFQMQSNFATQNSNWLTNFRNS